MYQKWRTYIFLYSVFDFWHYESSNCKTYAVDVRNAF